MSERGASESALSVFGRGRALLPATAASRLVIGLAGAMAVLIALCWVWPPSFFALAVLAVVAVAASAYRWPQATLVAVILVALGDPYLLRVILPPSVQYLFVGVTEGLVLAAAVGMVAHPVRRRALRAALDDPVLLGAAAFALLAAVSAVVNGVPPHVALIGILVTLDAVALYFMARMAGFDQDGVSRALIALIAVVAVAAVLGILQIVLTPDVLGFRAFSGRFGEGARVTGFLGNPNMLGAVVGMCLPFPLYATLHLSSRRRRLVAAALLLVLTLALYYTYSRGAWLSAGVGIVVGSLLVDWRATALFIGSAVVCYGMALVVPHHVLLRDGEQGDFATPDFVDTTINRFDELSSSTDVRVRFVVEAMPILSDHPLLGVGPGRYGGAVATIFRSPVYDRYQTGLYGYRTVHDFWLHLVGEVGALGAAAFIAMVVALALRLRRGARRAGGARFVILGGAWTMLLVVIINNFTEMVFEGNLPSVQLWTVLGMASLLAPAGALLGSRAAFASEASAPTA